MQNVFLEKLVVWGSFSDFSFRNKGNIKSIWNFIQKSKCDVFWRNIGILLWKLMIWIDWLWIFFGLPWLFFECGVHFKKNDCCLIILVFLIFVVFYSAKIRIMSRSGTNEWSWTRISRRRWLPRICRPWRRWTPRRRPVDDFLQFWIAFAHFYDEHNQLDDVSDWLSPRNGAATWKDEFTWKLNWSIARPMNWLIDWSTDSWLIDWLDTWLAVGSFHWLIDWSTDSWLIV